MRCFFYLFAVCFAGSCASLLCCFDLTAYHGLGDGFTGEGHGLGDGLATGEGTLHGGGGEAHFGGGGEAHFGGGGLGSHLGGGGEAHTGLATGLGLE